jgi:hypothetical protein
MVLAALAMPSNVCNSSAGHSSDWAQGKSTGNYVFLNTGCVFFIKCRAFLYISP